MLAYPRDTRHNMEVYTKRFKLFIKLKVKYSSYASNYLCHTAQQRVVDRYQ